MHTSFFNRLSSKTLQENYKDQTKAIIVTIDHYTYQTDEGGDHEQDTMPYHHTYVHHQKSKASTSCPSTTRSILSPANLQRVPPHTLPKSPPPSSHGWKKGHLSWLVRAISPGYATGTSKVGLKAPPLAPVANEPGIKAIHVGSVARAGSGTFSPGS
jgi:hypothetical protein